MNPTQYPAIRIVRRGFFLLTMFFVVFLTAYSWLSWHGIKSEQSKALSTIAELGGNALDSYFSVYEYSLKLLSEDLIDANSAFKLKQSRGLLKRYLQAHPDILVMTVNQPDGQLVVSSAIGPDRPLPAQGIAESFNIGRNKLMRGDNFDIGRAIYGPHDQGWAIPFRYAIRDKKGGLLYVLVAVLPLSRQQTFWHDLNLPNMTALGLLRDDAFLISRYPAPAKAELQDVYENVRTGVLVEHLVQNNFPPRGNVDGYNSVTNQDYLFGYRRLPHYPVTLFVTTPISNVNWMWWQQVRLMFLLLLFFTLGSYFVFRWISKIQLAWEIERRIHEDKFHGIYSGLLESEERFRRVASEAPFPMLIHAENGEVLAVNKAWTEASGYTHADIPTIGLWVKQAYGKDMYIVKEQIDRVYGINHRVDQGEFVIRCKDGSTRTWHFSAAPAGKLPDGRRYVVSMAQDVSERKSAQEKIEFLAYHDALTKLPNRLLARDHMEQAILSAQRTSTKVALLFVDLDKFKTINDSLGHVIGDGLLKGVALRLRECLRDSDTLSRQGGDEFLIVLKDVTDTDSITVVVEKILTRLAEPIVIEQHELAISLSIGIAVYPDDGKDFDMLLKQSDMAMYQAKESGRNTYRFHTEQMNTDAMEHLRMRNGLRRALELNEFALHYQPQINLATGRIIGAEALIRWRHPEMGMVPPGRFIAIAEESGLIIPIGDWVLNEACRQAMAWRREGLPELLMAVNLSAVQFKRGDIEQCVTQALEKSGLAPALLELELTESILIKDTEKVLATVKQLKALGVKFSIDDFGTGYSSLSYLRQFDADKLKIDQSFVRDMADDENDAAIVNAIIQMAKSLNLATIAEGVENERQLALLRQQQCDEVQGYHFARPMPADEFADYVRRYIAARK